MSTGPSHSRHRILLVDDQPSFREQASFFLEMEGYQVTTARDGVEALGVLASLTPDLILADVMMPRMNGCELRNRILREPHLAGIPFIFVTARDRSTNEELARADVEILSKPFDPEELLAILERHLGEGHEDETSLA